MIDQEANELLPVKRAHGSFQIGSRSVATETFALLKDFPITPPDHQLPLPMYMNSSSCTKFPNALRSSRTRNRRFRYLQMRISKLEGDGRADCIFHPPARLTIELTEYSLEDGIDAHGYSMLIIKQKWPRLLAAIIGISNLRFRYSDRAQYGKT